MRRWIVAIMLGTTAPLWAAGFEGEVDYEIRSAKGGAHEMNYQIKPPRTRLNIKTENSRGLYVLTVPAEKAAYAVMPDQKMVMKQAIPDDATLKKNSAEEKVDFVNTGKKETIAGRTCTVYTIKSRDGEGEMCNAEGMGTLYVGNQEGGNSSWEREARAKGQFPLRITFKNAKDGKTMTMIAKRVEAKSLPASLFSIPSDYQVIEGMGAGMMKRRKP